MKDFPLFPLHTVLFPGGILPLRIFEPRYLDMIGECLRSGSVFGVCLITGGQETGAPAACCDVGTSARITDWNRMPDGLLGISVTGDQRFRVLSRRVRKDNLLTAEIEWLKSAGAAAQAGLLAPLAGLLERILSDGELRYATRNARYDDAPWVSCRLAELLPIPLSIRQELLELDDAAERLARIAGLVAAPAGDPSNERFI
jgi:Lon protease-like protein